MKRVVVFGEALIDFIPQQRGMPLKDVQGFERQAGGAPANVAACIAKLGGSSAMIGQVGDDAFGQHVIEVLNRVNVDTRHLLLSKTYPTALAFVTLRHDGERDFIFMRNKSADLMIRRDDLPPTLFQDAWIFHLGSNLFMDEEAYQVSRELVQEAKKEGLYISFDPNVRPLLWPNQQVDRDKILSIIDQVDILKVSEEELFFLIDWEYDESRILEAVGKISSMGPRLVVVTLGEKGCAFSIRHADGSSTFDEVAGFPVTSVDTTGAGDAFIGALLYRLSSKPDFSFDHVDLPSLISDLRFANAVGALTTTKAGAINGLPTQNEVRKLLLSSEKEVCGD